jgi:hypothetical protein
MEKSVQGLFRYLLVEKAYFLQSFVVAVPSKT